MSDQQKPFTYAAEQLLEISKKIGEIVDSLLEGRCTKEDLDKWKGVIQSLSEAHIEVVGSYIVSGAASDDFFSNLTAALKEK